ncbi:hypothetical protein D3C81_1879260 [compost metagenome]
MREGARSAWPMIWSRGIRRRVHRSSSRRSSVAICPGGNGERPSLSSSMPIEAELTSLIVPQRPLPACQARSESGTSWYSEPSLPTR